MYAKGFQRGFIRQSHGAIAKRDQIAKKPLFYDKPASPTFTGQHVEICNAINLCLHNPPAFRLAGGIFNPAFSPELLVEIGW